MADVNGDHVLTLVQMGFDVEAAYAALLASDGDVQVAAQALLHPTATATATAEPGMQGRDAVAAAAERRLAQAQTEAQAEAQVEAQAQAEVRANAAAVATAAASAPELAMARDMSVDSRQHFELFKSLHPLSNASVAAQCLLDISRYRRAGLITEEEWAALKNQLLSTGQVHVIRHQLNTALSAAGGDTSGTGGGDTVLLGGHDGSHRGDDDDYDQARDAVRPAPRLDDDDNGDEDALQRALLLSQRASPTGGAQAYQPYVRVTPSAPPLLPSTSTRRASSTMSASAMPTVPEAEAVGGSHDKDHEADEADTAATLPVARASSFSPQGGTKSKWQHRPHRVTDNGNGDSSTPSVGWRDLSDDWNDTLNAGRSAGKLYLTCTMDGREYIVDFSQQRRADLEANDIDDLRIKPSSPVAATVVVPASAAASGSALATPAGDANDLPPVAQVAFDWASLTTNGPYTMPPASHPTLTSRVSSRTRVRREQDYEYEAGLAADQQRLADAQEAHVKEATDLRNAITRFDQLQHKFDAHDWPTNATPPNLVTTVRLILPTGTRVTQAFHSSDSTQTLWRFTRYQAALDYKENHAVPGASHETVVSQALATADRLKLWRMYPRTVIADVATRTLADEGLVGRVNLVADIADGDGEDERAKS